MRRWGTDAAPAAPGPAGLSVEQVAQLRCRYGPNLPPPCRPPVLPRLGRQVTGPVAVVLWAAAALTLLAGLPELAVTAVVVVLVNTAVSFTSEYRADRLIGRVRDRVPRTAVVRRDGYRQVVAAHDLVPGDLVLLGPGDRVGAQLRVERACDLRVAESPPVGGDTPRRVGDVLPTGGWVTGGQAEAVVVATGGDTRPGTAGAGRDTPGGGTGPRPRARPVVRLTRWVRRPRRPRGPLLGQLRRVVTLVTAGAVVAGAGLFGLSRTLGWDTGDGFLLALAVVVALVPATAPATATLSTAHAARRTVDRGALVKRLESVDALGSTTFICTGLTGILTQDRPAVSVVWTPVGVARVTGDGFDPTGEVHAAGELRAAVTALAGSGVTAADGRAVWRDGDWSALGDPVEAALHVLACRLGIPVPAVEYGQPQARRYPFDARRRRASVLLDGTLHVTGAPESVLPRCRDDAAVLGPAGQRVHEYGGRGLRVLAVARRPAAPAALTDPEELEQELELLGLVGFTDPPRAGAAEAVRTCRRAGIRLAVVTGEHPATACAVASQVGLLGPGRTVIEGRHLPADDAELATVLQADGVVVARACPEDRLRIARVLRAHGQLVTMTGNGVDDVPALREAAVGVATDPGGTGVAREAAGLVLLDGHFGTLVAAVELGRATRDNVRRSLTYQLAGDPARLAPFLVWAFTAGAFPLALSVPQLLALGPGTDVLPALALGAEPPNPRTMWRQPPRRRLPDRRVLVRVGGVLGPAVALVALAGFTVVLLTGGWRWGDRPDAALLATASGTAFTAVMLGQLANAFACRSEDWPPWRLRRFANRFLLLAVAVEALLLVVFLTPPLARLLDGDWPTAAGWLVAAAAVPVVLAADAGHKARRLRSAG